MTAMNKFFGHLKTVLIHKHYVFQACCKAGIPWQGLIHDLSKFTPEEFFGSVRYYTGVCSPIGAERKERGYSRGWLHHKGRNKHHWEYWVEFRDDGTEYYVKMPVKYAKEMCCDWLGAGKAYNGKYWDRSLPLKYYNAHQCYYKLNDETRAFCLHYLQLINDEGPDAGLAWLREQKSY